MRTGPPAGHPFVAPRALGRAGRAIAGSALALAAALTLAVGLGGASAAEPSLSPLCPGGSPATADATGAVGAAEARRAAPRAALAPSVKTFDRSTWTPVEPSLHADQSSGALAFAGTLGTGSVASAPAGGLELGGALCMVPAQTTSAESGATLVNGDSALYANSAPDTDTIVRPTASGAAIVESLRGDAAPASFSWRLGLPAGTALAPLRGGGVAVTDPASPAPESEAKPSKPNDLERLSALPDAGAQVAASHYEIDVAERETGHRVLAAIAPAYAIDSHGDTKPVALSASEDGTITASPPSGSTALVVNAAAKHGTTTAAATPPQPVNSYPLIALTDDVSVEAANAACAFAQAQPQGKRLMLLNFGQARIEAGLYGAGRKPFYSNDEILGALTQAASSYRQPGCHQEGTSATIAYGNGNYKLSTTGNDGGPMTPDLAKATGSAQLATAQVLRSRVNPEDGVAVAGDIEPGWDSSSAGLASAKKLALGADTGDLTYFNFGTAGHCPPYSGSDPGCGEWKRKDFGDLTQKHQAVPLPEVYRAEQALQWAKIRKKFDGKRARKCEKRHKSSCYTFAGATSEPKPCGAELNPSQSWKKLYKANPIGSVGNELIYYNPNQLNC